MYALDFEYDRQHLSDYGFIICDFNSTKTATAASAGSKITLKTVPYHQGKKHGLVSASYTECLQTTFDICKNPDIYNPDEMWITNDEYRDIMRWLNRSHFLRFQVVYENDPDAEPCYYEGSFTVEKITIREVLYGLRLTLKTNRPFGFGVERTHVLEFDSPYVSKIVRDLSDEEGQIYPYMTIKCKSGGDLSIYNEFVGRCMIIKNCRKREIITVDCYNHIISSNMPEHDICNDFNYEYFSIGNTLNNRDNKISVSLPCSIEIKYSPIIKDTP